MEVLIQYIIAGLVALVGIIVLMGLWNFFKGGSSNLSQKLMRARVFVQFIAILFILLALYLNS